MDAVMMKSRGLVMKLYLELTNEGVICAALIFLDYTISSSHNKIGTDSISVVWSLPSNFKLYI